MKNPAHFPDKEHPFFIEGPKGPLELLLLPAKSETQDVGVICHPHPLHEGTMHNKVVHTVSRAFHQRGLHAVRFNYRGVGKSQGTFGDSVGELEDLLSVLAWVKMVKPLARFWLAGFSFGSYIAAKGATLVDCQQLLTIAPAVHHQPYQELGVIPCPWLVIQGEKDEVVPKEAVYAMVLTQSVKQKQIELVKVEEASHFFHGQLVILRNIVETRLIRVP